MDHRRPRHRPVSLASAIVIMLVLSTSRAASQVSDVRFTIDRDASLSWYQVNPHTSLLWGTTCPSDPFWRAGDSRGEPGGTRGLALPKTGSAMVAEKVIPLWQRPRASAVCRRAVRGEFTAADTVNWRGVKGTIWIKPDSLYSGLWARDRTANRDIFGIYNWPEIKFVVDSLADLVPGDTVRGNAYGSFFFRNVETPTVAALSMWRDPLGLRVMTRVSMVPTDLVEVYGVSIHGIRLGLSSGNWQLIWFGVDAILNPSP